MGISVREGYGLTETSPIVTLTPQRGVRLGYVGKVLPGVDVKSVDASDEGVGEIAVRGPNVMKGYFNNEQATRETFDGEWLLTGDLGVLTADRYLKITGRKKSLIVNREGKNIYPEEVEMCINQSDLILESLALAFTDSGESGEKVGLIVVPDQDVVDARAAARGRGFEDGELAEVVRAEVKRMAQSLSDYKRPRRIQVRNEEFEKTTTQKIKRYLYAIDMAHV